MNAVEIEQAISELADQSYDAAEFPFAFLECFDNSAARSTKLRNGTSNKTDMNGVLQAGSIHIKTCDQGQVPETLAALKDSTATQTKRNKVRFVLATDGEFIEAEDLQTGEPLACSYTDLPNHFVFFWPLAGLSKTKQLAESEFDVRATLRLNKLYVALRSDNPEWGKRSHDMNHFIARLIFLFFAEDTDILSGDNLFTSTVNTFAKRDGSNTHEVIGELFRAMDTPIKDRARANLPNWANTFPYVNGGLFSGCTDVPHFSLIAQRYLIQIGGLPWDKINPDIFGSMIQAVADDEERSMLGMHYTSVPNILKVLNPLFLDDLNDHLDRAGDSPQKLLNLRKRMSNIRVFDPACGSGNFLVIAYKQMRQIEAAINERRNEATRESDISIQNFRGIELRDFSAEIARLALIIAEYQCDVLYRGPKVARDTFLPLDAKNWITQGNALRLDWLDVCPPTGKGVKLTSDDLFDTPLEQIAIDFENEGGETYICGNPPYLGSKWQSTEQKEDLGRIFDGRVNGWKSLDYVAGWFMKAADYGLHTPTVCALVTTNSICQGSQVPILWPALFRDGHEITFAHTSFKWANLASHNAGVTVAIVAITNTVGRAKKLFSIGEDGETMVKSVSNINGYLVPAPNLAVISISKPNDERAIMQFGNHTYYGVDFLMEAAEGRELVRQHPTADRFIRPFLGSREVISGRPRACVWVSDKDKEVASDFKPLASIFSKVASARAKKKTDKSAQALALTPHKFREQFEGEKSTLVVPAISSENRDFIPIDLMPKGPVVGHKCYALYDAPLWNLALIASRIHWVWIGTVCVRMRTDFSYSNTLGWNTFPVPKLTEKNKVDLTACAEDILLAREAHFPATIAELYKSDTMPENLKAAHYRNDETLERIYIGRRFKNDTERLEKLFEMYTKMTTKVPEQ
ncbi:class I SAM-dependent DNA methyltransferase [Loktanella salsilacus]|uniref:class I SAM-dependent DNA methyltransferase n=1 Tax=Loktanella salsilacus TaxID=195913 RepID=UPI0030F6F01D